MRELPTEYNNLREAVFTKNQESPEEQHFWINHPKLGDKKPSALAQNIFSQMPTYQLGRG